MASAASARVSSHTRWNALGSTNPSAGARAAARGRPPPRWDRPRPPAPLGGAPRLDQFDGVALLPGVDLLLGAVRNAQTLDALVVVVAVGLRLDQRRALAGAGAVDRALAGLPDGDRVHPVADLA